MKTSSEGLALIKRHEGCRLTAYRCPEGVPTIGYGSTRDVRMGLTITPAEADARLAADLAEVEAAIAEKVTVPLSQTQFDALASWAFNVGPGWLGIGRHKPATFIRKLNAGDYGAVPAGLRQFCHGQSGKVHPGLVKRRAEEAALWLRRADDDTEPMPQAVRPAPVGQAAAKRFRESWTITGILAAVAGWIVDRYADVVQLLTSAATDMAGLRNALAGVGFDPRWLGVGLVAAGLAVALARQFQPRSGGPA